MVPETAGVSVFPGLKWKKTTVAELYNQTWIHCQSASVSSYIKPGLRFPTSVALDFQMLCSLCLLAFPWPLPPTPFPWSFLFVFKIQGLISLTLGGWLSIPHPCPVHLTVGIVRVPRFSQQKVTQTDQKVKEFLRVIRSTQHHWEG